MSQHPTQAPDQRPDLAAVLARRDERRRRQAELLDERHMPLVQLTMVSPGEVKTSPQIRALFELGRDEIVARVREWEGWPIWWSEEVDLPTGPELLLAVDAEPGDLKRAMVAIEEEHPQGRLFDIDVIDDGGDDGHRVIGRERVGLPARRCLVCDEPAAACARSRRHEPAEVLAAVAAIGDR